MEKRIRPAAYCLRYLLNGKILDTGYWILDTGYWIMDTRYWILDNGYKILEALNNVYSFWFQSA
ncbi:MAG: hypothetical protein WBO39_03335 [Ferruginibacter sp.]